MASTIFYMMLCFTLSSIQSWLDFTFKIVLKTILQWATKASWFTASSLIRFWTNLEFILEPSETQNLQQWTINIGPMDDQHWPNHFSYRIMLQDVFFDDFWGSKTSPRRLKTPQDGSKAVSRHFQDSSRRFWTLPRRVPTQSTFGKKRFSIYNAQWTDQSPQSIVHSSPCTIWYSQFIICKSASTFASAQFM